MDIYYWLNILFLRVYLSLCALHYTPMEACFSRCCCGHILTILVTLGFSVFVNNFGRYNLLYGSIGTIMVVMIMIFLNSLVVMIGFEINLSINTLKTIR